MQEERLLSVGIDVGTSTTHCVFSRLTLSNTASSFSIPRIQITGKEILFRAPMRLTPFLDADTIDAQALAKMVETDYAAAGLSPGDIRLGAVIITGETARKRNARAVTKALSAFAGDFVVATAGPALESILAGRGSGAAEMSRTAGLRVANLDIGGGTTNIAVFERGEPVADGCVDIGGRLLRFRDDDETVLSFSSAMDQIARSIGLQLKEGGRLRMEEKHDLARRMAGVLEEAVCFRPRTALHDALVVGHALPGEHAAELFMFSGGVADCVYESVAGDALFHDLGRCLGKAVAQSAFFLEHRTLKPAETSRATVIGAGAYSVAVSGSTVNYRHMTFPLASLPAAKVLFCTPNDLDRLPERIAGQYRVYDGECAICMDGIRTPSFQTVEEAAERIAPAMEPYTPKVVILREDMAKALGQALARRWPAGTPFLCIDGISLAYGDTVDIGAPLSDGRVIPVVVKTFAFSQDQGR